MRMSLSFHTTLLLVFALFSLGCQGSDSRSPDHATRSGMANPQPQSGLVARFAFDGGLENSAGTGFEGIFAGERYFSEGLQDRGLKLEADDGPGFFSLPAEALPFHVDRDFSVQFWMRTEAESGRRFVVLSQKDFPDNSLASQKQPGWVFYVSGGTWAWTMGSGSRRITYERDNGSRMPLNDGLWHQLTMTYSSALSEVRLFYDGVNWVTYNVSDSDGFDFTNPSPLVVGWEGPGTATRSGVLPTIRTGAHQVLALVDAFNALGLRELESDELLPLIVDPRRLFEERVDEAAALRGNDSLSFRRAMEAVDWEPIREAESGLMANPYTVHQNMNFTGIAPVSKVYSLVEGQVVIQDDAAAMFAERERLYTPDFEMDNLAIWNRALAPEEVLSSYDEFFEPAATPLEEHLSAITAAAWNIWHGGKHWTESADGWDSRARIAEMLEVEGADVIMMQETYSSGDFIAAELGYYFATTVDWDYLNQGANISVLSRYPIRGLYVQEDSPFQNVGVRVTLSKTQDMYVMSNWYGMDQFPAVFDFHSSRFEESDVIPVLFAGDFNAVPHTDGGDSPASRTLLEAGFTDAFRSLYPDVQEYPGWSHRSDRRIDQLYYKGIGLKNTSTRVISTWPGGFPSDHYLILSMFDLDYTTRGEDG
jgi:exonuclease III